MALSKSNALGARAKFYTDRYKVYKGVIPPVQPRAISKLARQTSHVERFNCTLRQRISRWVRATLSFSKKLSNHIGAMRVRREKGQVLKYELLLLTSLLLQPPLVPG